MSCAHGYVAVEGGDGAFAIDASSIVFGRGAIAELGERVQAVGGARVALFTDRTVARLPIAKAALDSLHDANIDAVVYDAVRIEPNDASFLDAARFAREGHFDAYVSVGGGSVIDTCKAAILYATYPADFLTYVNAPVGAGSAVPGSLPPHIACPTTSGTGSELTGIAICDVASLRAKTGIASRHLRPSLALVDPNATATLPAEVVAASGFDVLSHALESFTARPFTSRPRTAMRPMSQGRNPWSDLGSAEALRLCGKFLVRAVTDSADAEAREAMAWAATLAGAAFGNAGVHVPHAMAYAVAGLVRDFRMPSYPDDHAMVPHGISVIVNAPFAFGFTARSSPERHREAALLLGGAPHDDLSPLLERMMRRARVPVGLEALGYGERDIEALVAGTIIQRRLLDNAPLSIAEAELTALFRGALRPTS